MNAVKAAKTKIQHKKQRNNNNKKQKHNKKKWNGETHLRRKKQRGCTQKSEWKNWTENEIEK